MADKTKATYTTRRKAFVIDEASTELGQKNDGDQDFNRAKVHQRDLGDLSIVSTLSKVEYGSWDGNPACLIAFSFSFDSGNATFCRFTNSQITIEFTSRQSGSADPVIINFGPRRLLGEKREEARRWLYVGEFAAKVNVGPVEIGPNLKAESEGSYTKDYQEVVKANDWGDGNHKYPNTVKYWLKENKIKKGGIPDHFDAAIVVAYNGPFQAVVDVSSTLMFNFLAQPWTKDDPVLFEPGVEHGAPIRGNGDSEFSTLGKEDWMRVVTSSLDAQ